MEGQIKVQYKDQPVTFDVLACEDDIYRFRLAEGQDTGSGSYMPEKVVIRRKGKLWVSDVEGCPSLTTALIAEINRYNEEVY